MNEKIERIVEIIKDYRREDISWLYTTEANAGHVTRWITQFDEDDREFVLSEFLHLLPQSYLTKENTLNILGNLFEKLREDFKYESVQDFLKHTKFLDCQEEGKSQKVFLSLINDILQSQYEFSLSRCGEEVVENWIYIDDVLASGGTFRNDLLNEINNFNRDDFKKSGIKVISVFVILHSWALQNVKFMLSQKLDFKVEDWLKFYLVSKVDNYPRIGFYNQNPSFNNLYPIKSELGEEVLTFVENAFVRDYDMRNGGFAFRDPSFPREEKFFSNGENRIRYENIMMKKGFDIMKSIENPSAISLRPLGMTPPSYKTLGTGTHFFTWRNVSNTCPIVFWWGANGWYPLFPVKNRGHV